MRHANANAWRRTPPNQSHASRTRDVRGRARPRTDRQESPASEPGFLFGGRAPGGAALIAAVARSGIRAGPRTRPIAPSAPEMNEARRTNRVAAAYPRTFPRPARPGQDRSPARSTKSLSCWTSNRPLGRNDHAQGWTGRRRWRGFVETLTAAGDAPLPRVRNDQVTTGWVNVSFAAASRASRAAGANRSPFSAAIACRRATTCGSPSTSA